MSELSKIAGPNGNASASVVFVHGLGGDLRTTWQQEQNEQLFWPQWLAEDVNGLAVYCVGYEAPVSRFHGAAMHLTDRAKNILELVLANPELRQGKLILIGHSLGGLVIKQLLRVAESEARERPEAASLIERAEKIAYLATPHSGSSLASWGDRLRILIRPSAATVCLVRNDANLRDLNDWYRKFANARNIAHLVLTETKPMRIVGLIVSPDSSDPGLSRSVSIPIDADHLTICKPASRTSEIYLHVQQFVSEDLQPLGANDQEGIVIASAGDKTITTVAEEAGKGGSPVKVEDADLRRIAQELLTAESPPSLLPLFPDASGRIRQALEQFGQVRRTVSDVRPGSPEKQKATQIGELLATEELHHLLLAHPGSGKTHALWHAARDMLAGDGVVPIFIRLGQLAGWDDVVQAVADIASGIDVAALLRDSRVCVFLDGWSEFASGYGINERAKAMRVLSRTRVIANSRRGVTSDTQFRIWNLDPPPVDSVRQAIRTAFPESPPPGPALIELLRLPLALSLFILLGGSASTRGELLTRFHEHLSHDLPERFRDVVAGAVASLTLSTQPRSYVRLENEIRERATQAALTEPAMLLRRLGTLQDRAGTVVPVHDLYWSWLSGLGLLREDRIAASVPHLVTRECYELALEAGALPKPRMVTAASKSDVTLAALLSAHLDAEVATDNAFVSTLKAMFGDDRLPIRCRAALAAFRSRKADLLRPALNVLTEIHEAKLYVPAFDSVLIPADLFLNRAIISDWLGAGGTDQLIDAIAYHGEASWGIWFEQMASSGKLSMPVAVAAALACEGCVPEWTVEQLPTLINSQSWKLHAVASRGTNIAFAGWLAEHYDEFVDTAGIGKWFDLNKVLVSCGNDATFERLLSRFPSMATKAQETLGFAIVDRGDPWIARFQQKAFSSGAPRHHHALAECVSLGIDDETARGWIKKGPSELGWRVLIARHGTAVVPEMIADLPESFAGLHDLPALSAMRFLTDAPEALVTDILKRIQGTMQPKAMEDVIDALARVRSIGVQSIVRLIVQHPLQLPTYHLAQALRLLKEWEKETHLKITVKSPLGDTSFEEWVLRIRVAQDKHDPMFRRALSVDGDIAARFMLTYLRDDEIAIKDIIGQLRPIAGYNEALFEFLITNPNLSALVLKVFSGAFDTFPESALLRAIDAPGIDFGALLRALATSSTPTHHAVHKAIVIKVLARPLDLFGYRDVAKILRVHPTRPLVDLLKSTISTLATNEMWLVREIETERGELLIDEEGQWLA